MLQSWKLGLSFFVVLSLLDNSFQYVRDYTGFQVLRLYVKDVDSLLALARLQEKGQYDFWKEPEINATTDIMVSPEQVPEVEDLMKKYNISHDVMYQNLNSAITAEQKTMLNRIGTKMTWDAYHRLDTIHDWMDSLVKTYRISESLVKVEVEEIGESFEKRPMRVLKISRNWVSINGQNRSAIWLDGGIHAREWIGPATVTYIANEIIQANLRSENWASLFDWYIFPVMNPDGYEYSHTNDRFWRKTRSYPRQGSSIIDSIVNLCIGADPNRNWNFQWGGPGASGNPCAQNYRGRESASEIEIQNLQNFILSKKDNMKLYLTLHSYSQLLLIPWGYSYKLADDYDEMFEVAKKAKDRLEKVQGTTYKVGSTANLLYPASGGSHDWAKGVAGIKYSYAVELPDRGFYGFLLPGSRIKGTGEETLALVKSMAEDMIDIYYNNKTGKLY